VLVLREGGVGPTAPPQAGPASESISP
jgi:hypothetical protein